MAGDSRSEHAIQSISRDLSPVKPQRFQPFPSDVMEAAYRLWSTTGNRSGARTVRLLAHEHDPDVALPSPATVNRWSLEHQWSDRADRELLRTRNRNLRELRSGLMAAAILGKDCLLDSLTGGLDGLEPSAVACRLKATELALRTAERSGLLSLVADADLLEEESPSRQRTIPERAQAMRELIVRENGDG